MMEQPYELVSSPVEIRFTQIIREARSDLFIASPYIKDYGVQAILNNASVNRVRLLTNLDLMNVTGAGFDIDALLKLWGKFGLSVSSLGKLHAKVYIADDRVAFVTSANLTRGGLRENYEYGVILRDENLVSTMLVDMSQYFSLGNLFSREKIQSIKNDILEIRALRRELEESAAVRRLRQTLKKKEDALQTKILLNRIEGRTVNSIFAETQISSRDEGSTFDRRTTPVNSRNPFGYLR